VRDFLELVGVLLVLLMGTLATLVVIAAGHEYSTVRGKIAAIEQLREDALRLRGAEASGVLALVAQANGEIAYHKAMNVHPLLGWSTPNRWADVRPIRIRLLREVEPEPERPGSPPSGEGPSPHFGYTPNRTESERFIRSLERGAKP
jgi:hypothetical protein